MGEHIDKTLIQIRSINSLESSFNFPTDLSPDGGKLAFHYDLEVEMRIDFERALIATIPTVEIFQEMKQEKQRIGRLSTEIIFEVKGIEKIARETSEGPEIINEEIPTYLNEVSISTCRGILYERLRGTSLSMALLPLINLK